MRISFSRIGSIFGFLSICFSSMDSHADTHTDDVSSCNTDAVACGFYFGSRMGAVFIEMNVHSTNRLSMAFYFGLGDNKSMFHSESMEYTYNPGTCRLTLLSGEGYWRDFGDERHGFSSPREIMNVIKSKVPEDIPFNLDGDLSGQVTPTGIFLMDIFKLTPQTDPRNWIEILEEVGNDDDWSMSSEEREEMSSLNMKAGNYDECGMKPSLQNQRAEANSASGLSLFFSVLSLVVFL